MASTDFNLNPTTTTLDEVIIALLLVRAADEVFNDPDVSPFRRLDALSSKIDNVREMASALRMLAPGLVAETNPEAIRARAAVAEQRSEQRQAIFRDSPVARAIMKRQEVRAATEAAEAAQADLNTAEAVLAQLERAGGEARDVVLARGAVAEARNRKAEADARVRALVTDNAAPAGE